MVCFQNSLRVVFQSVHSYIEQTSYAARRTIETYATEFHELNKAIAQFTKAGKFMEEWSKKPAGMGLLQELQELSKMVEQARTSAQVAYDNSDAIKDREFATQALCGAILQIAKQGISSVHHRLEDCPPGRFIGTQPIKEVIWQGRNQSLHYEEGTFSAPVRLCFEQLDNDFGSTLSTLLPGKVNLATHIIDRLGWHTYSAYEKDMIELLG